MINESNYHIFLDDFVAGRLNEAMELAFVEFLDAHPGILEGEELDDRFDSTLSDSFKAGLKKEIPIHIDNADELLIADMEGDLNPGQRQKLNKLVQDYPRLEEDKALYALTRLEADTSIRYKGKSHLKKLPVIGLYLRWSTGVAATLLLTFLVFRYAGPVEEPVISGLPQEEVPAYTPAPVLIDAGKDKNDGLSAEKASGDPYSRNLSQPGQNEEQFVHTPKPRMATLTIPAETPSGIDRPESTWEATPALEEKYNITLPEAEPTALAETNSQSIWQWAYKKVRKKAGAEEIVIPENEIPKDALNLVLAKVAPVIGYSEDRNGNLIRIGGLEFNRRTARQ